MSGNPLFPPPLFADPLWGHEGGSGGPSPPAGVTIDAATFLLLMGGAESPTPTPEPPIGTGETIVGAIIDAFRNAESLADFGGRIVFDEEFPNEEFPYVELFEGDPTQFYNTSKNYYEQIPFKFVIHHQGETGAETRRLGKLVGDLFHLCNLEFDDGYLMVMRRMDGHLERPPAGYTRGTTKQYQYVLNFRATVGRNP